MKTFTTATYKSAVSNLAKSQDLITPMVNYIAEQAAQHGNVSKADMLFSAPIFLLDSGALNALGKKVKAYLLDNVKGLKAPTKESPLWGLGKAGKAGVTLSDTAFEQDFLQFQAATKPPAEKKTPTDKSITKSMDALAEKLDNGITSSSMADLAAMVVAAEQLLTAAKAAYALTETPAVDVASATQLATLKPTSAEKRASKKIAAAQ